MKDIPVCPNMKDGDSKGVKEEKIGKYDITTCVEECKVSLTKRFKNDLILKTNYNLIFFRKLPITIKLLWE